MNASQDFAAARHRMVEEQLRRRGFESPRVLEAFERVPREVFVPSELQGRAYADEALPIEQGQTISQPYMVALMTDALMLSGQERVLEVGTGSGYQAAILAELAREVYSMERHEALLERAEQRLNQLGYNNVYFKVGDGAAGWPEEAPFDRIVITAAARSCPQALWEQLEGGGVLVGPFGGPGEQTLQSLRKLDGQQQSSSLVPCRFVPLISD